MLLNMLSENELLHLREKPAIAFKFIDLQNSSMSRFFRYKRYMLPKTLVFQIGR